MEKSATSVLMSPAFGWILAVLTLSAVTPCQAQGVRPHGPKKTDPAQFVEVEAGDGLFAEKRLWNGYDFAALVKAASQVSGKRGEFETAAEHQARLASLLSRPAYGRVTLDSSIALVVPKLARVTTLMNLGGAPVGYKYSSDEGMLQFCWSGEDYISDGFGRVVESVVVQNTTRKQGIGQNAFGAKTPISTLAGEDYVVGVKVGVDDRCPVGLQLSGADAQRLLEEVGVIVVGQLSAPYIDRRTVRVAATISSPIEIAIDYSRLLFRPKEMVVIKRATREVIARQQIRE